MICPVRVLCAIVAVLASLHAGASEAACGLRLKDIKQVSFFGHDGRGYEVFNKTQYSEMVEFTVERTSGSCSFFVGFATGRSGSFGNRHLVSQGQVLNYQLYRTVGASDVLKDFPLADRNEVLSGSVGSGQDSVKFRLAFLIPFQQIVPPGTYADTVVVKAYEGTLESPVQSPTLRDQQQLSLTARVPTTADFCLGAVVVFEAGYRNACVDFGEVHRRQVRELTLRARSNSGYRITFSSRNGGKLRITDPRDTSEIPYEFQVEGQPVPLVANQPVLGLQRMGLTSAFGNPHLLRFIIGEIRGASAGTYQDVIEVTLYPER